MDPRIDRNLWGESYESSPSDVLSLQSQVAQAVAGEISVRLTPGETASFSQKRTVNPESYDAYLHARYLWNQRTPESLRQALDEFQHVTELDPTSALGWSGLADGYLLLANNGESPPRETMPKVEQAAQKALLLDDSLAEAHASLAVFEWQYKWDSAAAEKEFERALALNPNYATARAWHGLFLDYTGSFDAALAEFKLARQLDPLSQVILANEARSYYYAKNFDEAAARFEKLAADWPDNWIIHSLLGQTYLARGDSDRAIRELLRARELSPSSVRNLGVLGDAYGRAGKLDDARKIAAELEQLSRTRYVPQIYSALVYIGIGDKDRAFQLLEKSYDERSEWMTQLNCEPEFAPLRSDPALPIARAARRARRARPQRTDFRSRIREIWFLSLLCLTSHYLRAYAPPDTPNLSLGGNLWQARNPFPPSRSSRKSARRSASSRKCAPAQACKSKRRSISK